jgi:hypothetical protein
MPMPRVRFTVRRMMVAAAVPLTVVLTGAALVARSRRSVEATARRQEARVRELISDESLAYMALRPARDGLTGLLYRIGVEGPHLRRGERAFMAINPVDPVKGLTRAAGPTIDACRAVPDGVPAELGLLRPVPVADPRAVLGPYSSRSRGDTGRLKGIEFYTYGGLDVGIKDGALVVVRVR